MYQTVQRALLLKNVRLNAKILFYQYQKLYAAYKNGDYDPVMTNILV